MDDYTRELMDLKTLVARTLEKKGVLAKIRAELRSTVFQAIEEEDRALKKEDGASPALLGSCNDQAKQLHASPSGKLLTALICEYLEWAQLGHTLKVYLPECNLREGFWKSELSEKFGAKFDVESIRGGETGPLLMEILETYLKHEEHNAFENLPVGNARRSTAGASTSSPDDCIGVERHMSRLSSSHAGSIPPLGRHAQGTESSIGLRISGLGNVSDRVNNGHRKEDHGQRSEDQQHADNVIRTSNSFENIQLDRKARSLTTSWRNVDDGITTLTSDMGNYVLMFFQEC